MNVTLNMNAERADAKAEGPWHLSPGSHWMASVNLGDLTIILRDEDGAQKALALADALREAAGSVLAELEGVTA